MQVVTWSFLVIHEPLHIYEKMLLGSKLLVLMPTKVFLQETYFLLRYPLRDFPSSSLDLERTNCIALLQN